MRLIRKNDFWERCIWLLTVALVADFVIYNQSSLGSVILLTITALIFLIDAIQNNWIIAPKTEVFHVYVLAFCVFCFISYLWAWLPSQANEKGTTIFEILICMSVLYHHYAKQDTVAPLINALMWSGYVVTIYTFVFIGFSNIMRIASSGDRLGNSYANINMIGSTAAISFVLAVHNILFIEKKLRWQHLFSLPALIMVGISGSRKTLVFTALGVVIMLLMRYRSRNIGKTILRWAVLAILIVAVFGFLWSLPIFSAVKVRMSGLIALLTGKGVVDSSSLKRQAYIQIGLEQFLRTPILGIGIGSSGALLMKYVGRSTYLHNNYVELLACGGIIGFLCYYSMYAHLLISFYRMRKINDPYLLATIVLLLLILLMDYGMVTYYSKGTYFYFVIFFLEERILLRRMKGQSNE